jgi:hypothetical protein
MICREDIQITNTLAVVTPKYFESLHAQPRLPLPDLTPGSNESRTNPSLSILTLSSHHLFIDLNTQPHSLHELNITILDIPHLRIPRIRREIVTARIVMNTQAHFLNAEVRQCAVDLTTCGERDRAERAVRRKCHVVGFCHRCYALQRYRQCD